MGLKWCLDYVELEIRNIMTVHLSLVSHWNSLFNQIGLYLDKCWRNGQWVSYFMLCCCWVVSERNIKLCCRFLLFILCSCKVFYGNSYCLQEAYDRAKHILQTHSVEHRRLAEALLKYETLDLEEIKLVIKGKPLNRSL